MSKAVVWKIAGALGRVRNSGYQPPRAQMASSGSCVSTLAMNKMSKDQGRLAARRSRVLLGQSTRLRHAAKRPLRLGDGPHLLEPDGGDFERVPGPQIFPEQFERQPAVVADLAEQIELAFQIEVSVARVDAVLVVLRFSRGRPGGVVKMHDGDLLSL